VSKSVKKSTKATVCIVESLDFFDEDTHREGEIISRTLRLSGKKTHYSYLRTRDELESFMKEFGKSNHRYLHVSCHGNTGQFFVTTEMIPALEFAQILVPHVNKRRVFLSTCLAADNQFAREILENSECWSILGPAGVINFDDAAIFWTTFYHLMFKESPDSMQRADIERVVTQCAKLVGEQFRFFYRRDGKVAEKILG
jgi:hypothetical protein